MKTQWQLMRTVTLVAEGFASGFRGACCAVGSFEELFCGHGRWVGGRCLFGSFVGGA